MNNTNSMETAGHILLVANVSKEHIRKFHIPFIRYMKEKSWNVDVACRLDEPVDECDCVYDLPCHRNPFHGGIRKSVSILKDVLNNKKYDAVICNTLTGSIIARLTKKALGDKIPPLFYINHGLHFFNGAQLSRWILGYSLEKLLMPFTDVLITINQTDYDTANKYLKPKKIEKLHGIGVDLARFRDCILDEEEKEKIRESLGVSGEDFVLTYVAEIIDNKNQIMLLEVLKEIQNIIPNAKLLLIGPEHDGGKLKKSARSLGINEKVIFLGWRRDIPELLHISDLYVASSKSEGLGLNIIEAMACDLPVVASRNRGHEEVISHGDNGYLVNLNDIDAMVKYVMELYENHLLREKFIAQAQRMIDKYDIKAVIAEEERIIISNLQ